MRNDYRKYDKEITRILNSNLPIEDKLTEMCNVASGYDMVETKSGAYKLIKKNDIRN